MFVGRAAELAVLRAEHERAASRVPRLVLVSGPAGSGKSELLREFVSGLDVAPAYASGAEAEMHYPFGVLSQLRKHFGDDRLPTGSADPLQVGSRLVEQLGTAQAANQRPLLLVIDDAQWADTPSLQALTFALRRLHADRVLTLFAHRDDTDERLEPAHRLAGERGAHLRLGGLSPPELSELSHAVTGRPLPRAAARRLHAHTEGHALTARALLGEVDPDVLADAPDPLPAPRSHALMVLRRLAGCAAETERLVVAAAVLGVRCELGLAVQLSCIDDPGAALGEAGDARLLELVHSRGRSTVSFTHQLVRSAVYHDLNPGRRLELHSKAGQLTEGAIALEHRAAGTAAPDSVLAADLSAHAAGEVAAGALSAGGHHLLIAGRVHPESEARNQLVLDGVSLLLQAGEVAEARGWRPLLDGLPVTARQRLLLGQLAFLSGNRAVAEEMLADAARLSESDVDDSTVAMTGITLGQLRLLQGRSHEAVEWGRSALTRAASVPALHDAATALVTMALGAQGNAADGLDLVRSLDREPRTLAGTELERLVARGVVRVWSDDLRGAVMDLRAVNDVEQSRRPLRLRLTALGCLAKAEFRLGAWDDSLAHGELGASLADDAEHGWTGAFLHAMASLVPACRGMWQPAREHAEAASSAAAELDVEHDHAYGAWAHANLAFARADPSGVVAAIEPVLPLRAKDGFGDPGVTPWREIYADALTSLGRLDDAEAELDRFEGPARDLGRRTSVASAATVRGRLHSVREDDVAARAAFENGIGHLEGLERPFVRALLEQAYGAHLRRRGARREAVVRLESAQEAFHRLGAAPFLQRCERELAACAHKPRRRSSTDVTQLTPQEVAVARLVAKGSSNRQVAAELVVSVKTVEYHLGNVFTKLDLRSRSQLAARFVTATPDSPASG